MAVLFVESQRERPKRLRGRSLPKVSTHQDELERLKREFISTASHELRTPLTSILGFSELLMNPEQYGGIDPDRQREFLMVIHNKAKDLTRIVDRLLDLDRGCSDLEGSLNKEVCSIETLVAEAVTALPKSLAKDRLEIQLTKGLTPMWCDREKLGQALEALLSNSLRFAPDGAIRVYGECSRESYHIVVEDEGVGIPQEDAQNVFQPFFRVDASDTACEGLGLGLPLARAIVEAHGGDISLKSALGAGTTVKVSVPLEPKT